MKIVHIDDNKAFLDLTRQYLERYLGHEVLSVEDPRLATGVLASNNVSLILLDHDMPELGGFELMAQLRESGDDRPIIFLTGTGDKQTVIRALNSGCDYYVEKAGKFSTTFEELQMGIDKLIAKGRIKLGPTRTEEEAEQKEGQTTFNLEETQIKREENRRLAKSLQSFVWETANQVEVATRNRKNLGLGLLDFNAQIHELNNIAEGSLTRFQHTYSKLYDSLDSYLAELHKAMKEGGRKVTSSHAVIKNLWIIAQSGLCLYYYQNPEEDQEVKEMDPSLFGGFVSALASFTSTLTTQNVEYVKMGEETVFFIPMGEIIVASIARGFRWIEVDVISRYLNFFGKHFLVNFGEHLLNPMTEWDGIGKTFTQEVEFITHDREFLEVFKMEILNQLFNSLMTGSTSPETVYWKIIQMYSNTSEEETARAFEMFDTLVKTMEQNITDNEKLNHLQNIIALAKKQLKNNLSDEKSELLVLADNTNLFSNVINNFLVYGSFCFKYITGLNRLKQNKERQEGQS